MVNLKSNYSDEETKKYNMYVEKMRDVLVRLREIISVDTLMTHSISPQEKDGEWYGVSAILGYKPNYFDLHFDYEVLDDCDTEMLARNAFVQMYGFKPDSEQDRKRKLEYHVDAIRKVQNTIANCENAILKHEKAIRELQEK